MDGDGQAGVARDAHLFDEYVALDFARRMIIVIVEAHLAHGDHFRMLGEFGEPAVCFLVCFRRVMWMHADGCEDCRVAICQANAGFKIGRPIA